eukprot:TRINITY_DN21601_c0_g1_i1.p1 TRINITY_DN21601_c0_g1~~TRINITY_DN21601_c0_g1_i1.p1  ORF type:complete len:552 (-),score=45.75 TRINITY_DN21601_c0_g1_i1:357-2012(-)
MAPDRGRFLLDLLTLIFHNLLNLGNCEAITSTTFTAISSAAAVRELQASAITYTSLGNGICINAQDNQTPYCQKTASASTECEPACSAIQGCAGYAWYNNQYCLLFLMESNAPAGYNTCVNQDHYLWINNADSTSGAECYRKDQQAPCTAPTVTNQASGGPCLFGSSIASMRTCDTQCLSGYTPSTPMLSCSVGVLTPSTFTCQETPCTAPTVTNQSSAGACSEGTSINSGSACTAQCFSGYIPSITSLACDKGTLTPSTFMCLEAPPPCTAPTVTNQPSSGACVEGANIDSGSSCTTQCDTGYSPSIAVLNCENATFTPRTFTCRADPCTAPTVTNQASKGACREGASIDSGSLCATQCDAGYNPSIAALNCDRGTLSPSTFTCQADPCTAPTVTNQASGGACTEGASIDSGSSCTSQCDTGYSPSIAALTCVRGTLTPSIFICRADPCTAPTVTNQASGGACAQGVSVGSGSSCTAQCLPGFVPSATSLACDRGTLSPSTFTCQADPCTAPTQLPQSRIKQVGRLALRELASTRVLLVQANVTPATVLP